MQPSNLHLGACKQLEESSQLCCSLPACHAALLNAPILTRAVLLGRSAKAMREAKSRLEVAKAMKGLLSDQQTQRVLSKQRSNVSLIWQLRRCWRQAGPMPGAPVLPVCRAARNVASWQWPFSLPMYAWPGVLLLCWATVATRHAGS